MDLRRKAYKELTNWKESKTHQALLVNGARQVGKTFLVRQFCKEEYKNVAEINFYDNQDARNAVRSAANSQELFLRLTAYSEVPIEEGKTVYFLDEIQECPEIVTAIKFLVEKTGCDYILSGSMLGSELKGIKSAPVGFMNTITMYPLDFEEFCWANSFSENLFEHVAENISKGEPIDEFVHKKLLDLFHKYLISGGMPEPVKTFVQTNDIQKTRNAQEAIVTQYRWDISKYADKRANSVRRIFDLIASELSMQDKRFTIKNVEGDSHFNRYDNDFSWLIDANAALPVYNVTEPRYPLLANIQPNKFKLFASDVGLLTYMCGMDVVRSIINERPDINYGGIYENAVAQELFSHGHRPCFFKKRNVGELDFLITLNNEVVPVEVKSGKAYTKHSAINHALSTKNYCIKNAIVLSEKNVEKRDKITYFPIYACAFL